MKEDEIISDKEKNKEAKKLQQKKNKESAKNYKNFCKIIDTDENECKYFKNMLSNDDSRFLILKNYKK